MTGELWQRAQEVFEGARSRPAGERGGFVAEACGEDAELRAEVESLLAHFERANTEFMQPMEPPSGVAAEGPDPVIGARVGQYTIRSVIAAGGMGTVYLAEQKQPRRDVAVKVMRAGLASRSVLRRFEHESQILARLRHPNIAQVYEAGTHSVAGGSVPYFAMEYVPEARTITEYADEQQLGTRARMELFATVCEAVHHGHQKGIIHRDLKPANILVDAEGQVKIIDFGVARATDADVAVTTVQTDTGQLVGTLQYMSPEQCDADPHALDTRSDVYSLGVVLYELLTGALPYDAGGTTIYQATRIIKEDEPRKLSSINRKLRGDIETIVLKALEKAPEKRYQSAADLTDDLRRHLRREPIEARPTTAWTRTVRWVGRNPAITTTVMCLNIAAIILTSTYVAAWFVKARPYEISLFKKPGYERVTGGYEARLRALDGRLLHTWTSEVIQGIHLAELVGRPRGLGSGKLAVLAFNVHDTGPFRGSLCAFDADGDLQSPVWSRRIETADVLPELRRTRGFVGEEFGVQQGWILDVFPERPGREVVVVFAHGRRSARVLRIYDLTGELLYQVWHDGFIGECYWMKEEGLLVLAGDSHAGYWDRGERKGEQIRALAVFALRPKVGWINDEDYLATAPGDPPHSPVWYMYLWPEQATQVVKRIRLRAPLPPNDAGNYVECVVKVDYPLGGESWIIDEFGREVEGTRDANDAYRQIQSLPDDDPKKLPIPKRFELRPTPPS